MAEFRKFEVVNSMTHPEDWQVELAKAFRSGKEVLLLLQSMDRPTREQIAVLCAENGYDEPMNLPPEQWKEYRVPLDLTEMAAKEQGIHRDQVCLIRPKPAD